ncbi:alpha/beta fold hydrolase [Nocardia caishijiensis]|uniref:Nucleoside-diphosphate-sugar epimerase n=1 Tax=Nocardia caishijiensis TaxID=184756 RepID=A0ABQ6YIM1_9NOCA|nr:alpha/beta fold hydrolase [Nocardia caishijiensis]KAF0845633.1 nucleoside-diphosphate-sugar epimerase [Nocardia caishijiensis]
MVHTDSIVFGAAGFIGRSLVAELLRTGHTVTAALRAGSEHRLTTWLAGQDVDTTGLTITTTDIAEPDLALGDSIEGVRDVYNAAALMKFGLDPDVARRVNLDGALHVLEWAARQPDLRRIVHITGYRAEAGHTDYRAGAYEASKVEADGLLRQVAADRNIPLTSANPSGVVGPGQYFGLSDLIDMLWRGTLPVLTGSADTFIPVVDLDYLTRFIVGLPTLPDTVGRSYPVLDATTPNLPELIRLVAEHLGVRAPRFTVPAELLLRLPRALTKIDPETLSFISSDRYDTSASDEVAARLGISQPPVGDLLRAYADRVVGTRNGTVEVARPAGFRAGTWSSGDHTAPDHVLLHGIPLDSDSWADLADALDGSVLAADLPGLGRSAASGKSTADWIEELLAPVRGTPVLVGHSLGTGAAVEYALRHPDRVSRLVLIAPWFLQSQLPWLTASPLAAAVAKRLPAARFAARLGIPNGAAIESAVAGLRRPGVARRTFAIMRSVRTDRYRAELAAKLAEVKVPVDIVVGADDPLTQPTTHRVTTVAGAGHYPQLTHPDQVVRVILGSEKPVAGRLQAGSSTRTA